MAIRGRLEQTPTERLYIRLAHCRPVAIPDRPRWQLLPRVWVPARAQKAFERLIGLLDRLEPPHLRAFMEGVLADEVRAKRLLTWPARRGDTEARPGSLLIESVARAEKAEDITSRLLLSRDEVGLAIVGALLLDIGRTRTSKPNARASTDPLMPEALNLCALDDQLYAEQLRSEKWVLGLCEILAPTLVAKHTSEPPALVTDLVHSLDALTTGAALAQAQRSIRTSAGDLLAQVLPPGRWSSR